MNGLSPAIDWRLIGVTLMALFMFGWAFDALVTHLGDKKEGYTSLLVVGGVLATLLGVALISWQCALLTLAMFTASGTPMIIGEVIRAIHKREQVLAALRKEIGGDEVE